MVWVEQPESAPEPERVGLSSLWVVFAASAAGPPVIRSAGEGWMLACPANRTEGMRSDPTINSALATALEDAAARAFPTPSPNTES